ncbi:hypothetical protein VTL71DRAFT_135 [Oculimacula yallundae]|uniref:Uncharacterized protein n=1 Tax=Oculimacula yallundae TaxID=86028 RepID=A0ABR4CZB4_9HELO
MIQKPISTMTLVSNIRLSKPLPPLQIDILGAGSQFDNVPSCLKSCSYPTSQDLVPSSSSSGTISGISIVKTPDKKLHQTSSSKINTSDSLGTIDSSCERLTEMSADDGLGIGEVTVSGVKIGGFLEGARNESVHERFMREESVVERLWDVADL